MTWTNEQRQELSRKVAEKFPISHFAGGHDENGKWIHDDWHTIMELCVKYGVFTFPYTDKTEDDCIAYFTKLRNDKERLVRISENNNDPSLAERIARMMALMEVELVDMLSTGLEWNIENHPTVMNEADAEALESTLSLLAEINETSGFMEVDK